MSERQQVLPFESGHCMYGIDRIAIVQARSVRSLRLNRLTARAKMNRVFDDLLWSTLALSLVAVVHAKDVSSFRMAL